MKTQTPRLIGVQNRREQFLLGNSKPPLLPVPDKPQISSGAVGAGRKKGREGGIIPRGLGIQHTLEDFAKDAGAPSGPFDIASEPEQIIRHPAGHFPPASSNRHGVLKSRDEAELTFGL